MPKTTKGTIEVFLQLGDFGEDVPANVEFSYTPGTPETMYDRFGDPGQPEDPEIIEIENIWVVKHGFYVNPCMLTEAAYDYICEQISEMEHD